ncbi:hypothetical protein [Actomonas aquatica]|uniref:Tetratricopeptide repeat protein n=1 Tax=Actomonas aquatica TaxID=2866162 RepID=A0ABZ1C557_9BACT|nr:hypothetical protein [Opitutus sp. WL0086]WRQ86482.1 hypothetical protein K1X11_016825 [Opitutus sp. WL0086]
MPKRLLGCFILVLGLLPCGARAQGRDAEAELNELVALQQELLGRAAMAAYQEEVESLRPRLQSLVFDYEQYLRRYPKKAEGYIAYSMLLGSSLVDERERAKALLLKANNLDPDLAIVKNQLGKYLAEEGKPLEALNYFLSAVQLEPEQALYHFQIGQLLGAARGDFLASGEWTAEQVDAALVHALQEAVRLDPDNFAYAYRLAESHYDVAEPDWPEALAAWQALAARATDPLQQQMVQLHEANVLLAMERLDDAETVLAGDFDAPMQEQRAALSAKLERLRNPPPAPAEVTAAEAGAVASMSGKPAAKTPARPRVEVPTFQAGELQGVETVNSEAVVELARELPAELPIAPLVDDSVQEKARDANAALRPTLRPEEQPTPLAPPAPAPQPQP